MLFPVLGVPFLFAHKANLHQTTTPQLPTVYGPIMECGACLAFNSPILRCDTSSHFIINVWLVTIYTNCKTEHFPEVLCCLLPCLFFIIRPFEKRTYYAMAMSVRLSVRPSEFAGLFFNVLWDINLKLGICIQSVARHVEFEFHHNWVTLT